MRLRRIIKHAIYFLTLCLIPLAAVSASSSVGAPQVTGVAHKRVLILYAYNNNVPTLQQIVGGISGVINSNNLRSADFVHEYLDITPPKYPAHRAKLGELLLQKYAGQQFDLIFTYSTEALSFLLNEGKELSPGSPCIAMFAALKQETGQSERTITHIPMALDPRGTLERGLELFPKTLKVLFVSGAAAIDKVFENQARTEFSSWQGKLEFEYTSQRSVEDLMKEVVHLPPNTLIIFSNVASDIAGKSFVPRDLVKTLASISNAPVLSMFSTQIDTGVVGGSMIDMQLLGVMIGNSMVALESGKPLTIEPASSYIRPMFNWTQIERWGINQDRLPAESVFINRPLTLWGQYKAEVVTALSLILTLSAMSVVLVMQNRRRKLAEISVRETADQLAAERDMLEERVAERTARLSEALKEQELLAETVTLQKEEIEATVHSLRESEKKYYSLFQDSPDAYLVIVDGVFVDCNSATEAMLHCDRSQIIGQPPDLISPEFQPDGRKSSESAEEKINDAFRDGTHTFEWVHRRLDRSVFFVQVSIAPMLLNGKTALFTTWHDITARKQAEKDLEYSELKYRTLYDSTSDAVMLLDESGFIDCNKATLKMLGIATRDQFCSTHPGNLSPPRQPTGMDSMALANQHIATARRTGSHRFEWIHRRADNGKDFHADVLLSAMELDGKPILQATVRDITDQKRAEEALEESNRRLEALSTTDALTGIANRRHFDEVLAKEHARHVRSGEKLSLILLDIDHFKAFNDRYGHVKGDECLRLIGRVLSECANRPADLAARYGGEEFACVLPETDNSGAVAIAERIRRSIQALAIPHKASSAAECVTASLGVITQQCVAGEPADEILTKVDTLLYRAKSSGRNRVAFVAAHDMTLKSDADETKGNFGSLV